MYFYYKKQVRRNVLKVCFEHKNATFSQSDLMQTNWATGSLWVLWIICKHFPCQCGTAYSVAAIDSDFDCGSPGLQHYVQGLSPDSCGQCEVWWRQQQPHVIAAPTVQHLFGRCCVMAWGGFVVKGGNLNAERYPGGFRLHISTAGDHTLSSNVPTEQFYQGLPPVLRSGEDWMTWQQLTDLTGLKPQTHNIKVNYKTDQCTA